VGGSGGRRPRADPDKPRPATVSKKAEALERSDEARRLSARTQDRRPASQENGR
jgi:hypothetical protein